MKLIFGTGTSYPDWEKGGGHNFSLSMQADMGMVPKKN
jgi:hypothetical protein